MKLTKERIKEIIHEELDSLINEKLTRKVIYRDGKRKVVYRSDKEGYKVVTKNGRPKEVRMSPAERRNRKKSQRKAARKRKSGQKRASRKRSRTMRKRGR